MKVGDMVKIRTTPLSVTDTGIIVRIFEKKCWRTQEMGKSVDWGRVEPEPHVDVMFKGRVVCMPMIDLEVIDAG